MPLNVALPPEYSENWYDHYANMHDSIIDLEAAGGGGSSTLTIRTVTAATTLTLTDQYLRVNSASALNVTVPPNSSVAFPVGSIVQVRRVGAGTVSLVAGSGVTLSGAIAGVPQHGSYALIKTATDAWDVEGGIV